MQKIITIPAAIVALAAIGGLVYCNFFAPDYSNVMFFVAGACVAVWLFLKSKYSALALAAILYPFLNRGGRKQAGTKIIQGNDEQMDTARSSDKQDNAGFLTKICYFVIGKFVTEQNTEIIKAKTRELQAKNEYRRAEREAYGWDRTINSGRAKLEEDAADTKAKTAVIIAETDHEKAKGARESVSYDAEITRLKNRVEIQELNQKLSNSEKSAKPKAPRKRTEKDIEAAIKKTRERDGGIDADPEMDPAEKMRRKNMNAREREELLDQLERIRR